VREGDDFLTSHVFEIIERYDGDNLLLIMADNLEKRSSLRSLFETDTSGKTAVLPCYNDEGASLENLIKKEVVAAGKTITSDALMFACHNLGEDRASTRMNLEKLFLYTLNKSQIEYDDVAAVLSDFSLISQDSLNYAVACGNMPEAMKILDRLLGENTAAVAIIRNLIRHYKTMYDLQLKVEQGASVDSVISQMRPALFFKNVPLMKKCLAGKSSVRIGRSLAKLIRAEIDCKSSGDNPTDTILGKLLTEL
jgi:DNA polymerase-3 subunit delta